MSSRFDELKGKVKESVGNLTGNDEMAHEGEREATQAKVEREAEGIVDQTIGTVQESIGDITDDEEQELEGKARQVEGDIKRAG